MTIETQPLEPQDWDDWYDRLGRAFGGPAEPPEERKLWRDLTEIERSLAAWDAGELVGTAGAFSFRVSVPGGAVVPAAGVTMVSVQPTHRRRGVLTAMMRRQLDDVRALGEPLAVLTSSEPPIYGRFGYGCASRQASMDMETARLRLAAPDGVEGVRLRLVAPEDAVEPCEAVYGRLVALRPGIPARRPGWERMPLLDPEQGREGAGELLCVLAETGGEVTGYARYAVKSQWNTAGADGTVVLRDLDAVDPVSYAALWRFLFGVDLTSRLVAGNRPVDDPVLRLVSDVRRCRVGVRDGLYVRLVDVGAALAARAYAAPVDVVLEVEDAFCPWNAGRWRLTGDTGGAACARSSDPADLALAVEDLAAVYLGGFGLAALAAAGRVRELRAGALTEASLAFRGGGLEPWLPHGF